MKVGNSEYWEVAFRKNNGSIIYIKNIKTGGVISYGSMSESLWKTESADGKAGWQGCDWGTNIPFEYNWSENENTLRLKYQKPSSSRSGVEVEVSFIASESNYFDIKMTINITGTDDVIQYINFPADLIFSNSQINEALFPVLPGVLLKKSFFENKKVFEASYPGFPGVFADFLWISTEGGGLTIYSIDNHSPITPLKLGLYTVLNNFKIVTYYKHNFGSYRWVGQSFTSPKVRLRVGQSKEEAALSYRIDNSFDKIPSLKNKLGDLYAKTAASPEIMLNAESFNLTFNQYPDKLFSLIPVPSILHLAGFQERGFDENTPDFLPPARRFGTTEDFINMIKYAKASGFLVMPYTNPTWWDDESPTMRHLPSPLKVKDITVLDSRFTPIYEIYNGKGGYLISPWAPFVQERLLELMKQMKENVQSDIIFEDQIGARSWWFDFNSSSPVIEGYIEGWIEHTKKYKDNLLATEQCFDRIAENEIGFYGSLQYLEKIGMSSKLWGEGNWEVFPLATMVLRDKVFFSQHDLSPETMTSTKENLIWNLSYGYQLNYIIWNNSNDDYDWLRMLGYFQRIILSRYADELITKYESVDFNATKTSFQNWSVTTNWDANSAKSFGSHTVSPQGVLIQSNDGAYTAGIFAGYNGMALTSGDHYIIEERYKEIIVVSQPYGGDTPISIEMPSGWDVSDRIKVFTYLPSLKSFVSVPSTMMGRNINFDLKRTVQSQGVYSYFILNYH